MSDENFLKEILEGKEPSSNNMDDKDLKDDTKSNVISQSCLRSRKFYACVIVFLLLVVGLVIYAVVNAVSSESSAFDLNNSTQPASNVQVDIPTETTEKADMNTPVAIFETNSPMPILENVSNPGSSTQHANNLTLAMSDSTTEKVEINSSIEGSEAYSTLPTASKNQSDTQTWFKDHKTVQGGKNRWKFTLNNSTKYNNVNV